MKKTKPTTTNSPTLKKKIKQLSYNYQEMKMKTNN